MPDDAAAIVVFAHGGDTSRRSARHRAVARVLQRHGVATLLVDLLTAQEQRIDHRSRALRFDIELLAGRLDLVIDWLDLQQPAGSLAIGLYGSRTAAATALVAAADRPGSVRAVVCRAGRPDLAGSAVGRVKAATLLVVDEADPHILDINRQARDAVTGPAELRVIARSGAPFDAPSTITAVAAQAADWFNRNLGPARPTPVHAVPI